MDSAAIQSPRRFLTAWLVCFLLMEVFGVGFVGSGAATKLDFRSFYAAGYLMRTHPGQLYDLAQQERVQESAVSPGVELLAFYHPSYETLMYAPFSLLAYRAAYLSFIAFNMLLLLAVLFATRPMLRADVPWLKSRPWLVFFLFLPLLISVAHGQDSILLLLLSCLAWRQLEQHKDMSAGCLLALVLFKFQIVLPIVALIAVWRGWRFVSGFLATASGVALLCFGVGGREGLTHYLRLLSGATSAIDKGALAQQRLSVFPLAMPNLSGLLYAGGGRFLHSAVAFDALIGSCALGLFLGCAFLVRRIDENAVISVAILCGLLVSYHLYEYDLTFLLLPIALLANRINHYVLASLFVLPAVILGLGTQWIFFLTLPMLAMLVNIVLVSRNRVSYAAEALPV